MRIIRVDQWNHKGPYKREAGGSQRREIHRCASGLQKEPGLRACFRRPPLRAIILHIPTGVSHSVCVVVTAAAGKSYPE